MSKLTITVLISNIRGFFGEWKRNSFLVVLLLFLSKFSSEARKRLKSLTRGAVALIIILILKVYIQVPTEGTQH